MHKAARWNRSNRVFTASCLVFLDFTINNRRIKSRCLYIYPIQVIAGLALAGLCRADISLIPGPTAVEL